MKEEQGKGEMIKYGPSALVSHECKDIFWDLMGCFDIYDANRIMCMATLNAIEPGIALSCIKSRYTGSAIREFYPTRGLTERYLLSFIYNLGAARNLHIDFYAKRIARVASHDDVIIDGVLQKAAVRNTLSVPCVTEHEQANNERTVFYAYSHELEEVLCAYSYPGNRLDAMGTKAFIADNHLTTGTIVCSDQVPLREIRDALAKHPQLHYIAPRNLTAKLIKSHDLSKSNYCLETPCGQYVVCQKIKTKGGKYLYALYDVDGYYKEERAYFLRTCNGEGLIDVEDYERVKPSFGLSFFESDLDLAFEQVLHPSQDKWWLDLVSKQYDHTFGIDISSQELPTRLGLQFISYISILILCRLRKAIRRVAAEYYRKSKWSFEDYMRELGEIYSEPNPYAPYCDNASVDDGVWFEVPGSNALALLARLGVIADPTHKFTNSPKSKQDSSNSSKTSSEASAPKSDRAKDGLSSDSQAAKKPAADSSKRKRSKTKAV